MAQQLDVSSSAPTLLFEDTAGGGKDYRFRLEAEAFSIDREKTGGGWDEVMSYDITNTEWRIRGPLVLEDSASVGPEVQLDYSGSEMWKVQSKVDSLELKRVTASGPRGPFDLLVGGHIALITYGGSISDIRRDGAFVFDEIGGSATIMEFQTAGVGKANISPSGKGIFAGIKARGDWAEPSGSAELGDVWLETKDGTGAGKVAIWVYVETGAASQGWRGLEIAP